MHLKNKEIDRKSIIKVENEFLLVPLLDINIGP